MVQRIYATKLLGIPDADLRRLEVAEQERATLIQAQRIATEFGVGVDEVLHQLQEIAGRIQRDGLEAEVRRLARDCDLSEEEAWTRYEATLEH